MDWRAQKAIAAMTDHLGREWSLEEIARSVNLSPSRLHQIFKDEIGTSPSKYLRTLRMQRAKELLEGTPLSVKEVRARVGAFDESHFIRDFKKIYGLSPAKYRDEFIKADLRDRTAAVPHGVGVGADGNGAAPAGRRTAPHPDGTHQAAHDGSHRAAKNALVSAEPDRPVRRRPIAPDLHSVALRARDLLPHIDAVGQKLYSWPRPHYRRHSRPAQKRRPLYLPSSRRPRAATARHPATARAQRPRFERATLFVIPLRRLIDPHAHPI